MDRPKDNSGNILVFQQAFRHKCHNRTVCEETPPSSPNLRGGRGREGEGGKRLVCLKTNTLTMRFFFFNKVFCYCFSYSTVMLQRLPGTVKNTSKWLPQT